MKEIEEKLKTKTKYFATDDETSLKVLCREVTKSGKETVYPFDGRTGGFLYKKLRKIVFDGVERSDLKGFRSFSYGYGFTKNLRPLVDYLESRNPKIEIIRIVPDGDIEINEEKKEIVISKMNVQILFESIRPTHLRHGKEVKSVVLKFMKNRGVAGAKDVPLYAPGSLKKVVNDLNGHNELLSKADIEALSALISQETNRLAEVKKKYILQSKQEVESIYLETVLRKFDTIYNQVTETKNLEKKWQNFFSEHPWIFTFLSPQALVYFRSEAYLGGQTISGKGATITDFIYKNKLTKNVCIFEIKTHLTPLIGSLYRKGSGVYGPNAKVTGGVTQGLDQKDKLTKEYFQKSYSTRGTKNHFEVFNPKVTLIVGKVSELKGNKKKSFELFRSGSKDVEIVGFDEIKHNLEKIYDLMK